MELLVSDKTTTQEFFLLLIICASLTFSLKISYKNFIDNNYSQFELSKSLVLISVATFFVIFLVKSSISLSLGLVGALSIVRFRTPIKDPYELAVIFVSIAVGIACAVNEKEFALVFVIFVHVIMIISYFLNKKNYLGKDSKSFLNRLLTFSENYIIEIESNSPIEINEIDEIFANQGIKYKILSQSISNNNILVLAINIRENSEISNLIENIKKLNSNFKILLREND